MSHRRGAAASERHLSGVREAVRRTSVELRPDARLTEGGHRERPGPTQHRRVDGSGASRCAFWSRKHGKKDGEQTMKEKTDQFFREEVRIGPNGEKIVTNV